MKISFKHEGEIKASQNLVDAERMAKGGSSSRKEMMVEGNWALGIKK